MLNFQPWKKVLILAVILIGCLGALPNAFDEATVEGPGWPSYLPSSQINLGLDLQGGSHMLLEIDMDSVIVERLDNVEDDIRRVLILDDGIAAIPQLGRYGLGVAFIHLASVGLDVDAVHKPAMFTCSGNAGQALDTLHRIAP